MSGETTQNGGSGTTAQVGVLGGTTQPNGAVGKETPVPVPAVSATGEKPAEKTPDQVATETKVADEAAVAKKTADDAAAKAAADKEWSDFKPTRGEGISTDEATLKEALSSLREAGLSTKQAQAVISLNDKLAAAGAEAAKAAQAAAVEKHFADQRAEHIKASSTDKEYGGKLDEATKVATRAFEKFVDPAALTELKALNWDTHPAIFKAFYKIGLALKDDSISGTLGAGGQAQLTEQQYLDQVYPSMAKR